MERARRAPSGPRRLAINETEDDPTRLIDEAVRYLPGGTYATTTLDRSPRPDFIFSHGAGAYVYTTDGERLLDVTLGHSSLILGHCSQPVGAAVKAQIDRGNTFTRVTRPTIDLARMVVEAVPCAEKVRLVNSGSEGVLLALRAVRAFTGREKVLKFEGAYHGFADELFFNTNYGNPDEWQDLPQSTPDSPGTPALLRDLVLIAPYNDLDGTREVVRAHRDELAGIFVEPVMRGIASRPGFLEGVREMASEFHIPLVFDEVNTGFRLALGGAQAFYGVTPDLAVFGKGMGSGYPIGAIAGSDEIMSVFDPASPEGSKVFSLGSFHGNALSATAGTATLTELRKPGTYERLNGYGDQLREGLSELFSRYDLPAQMSGEGSIVEFFFTLEPITDYRSTLRTNLRLKALLGGALRRHGVFGGGGRYTSSTCHGDDELTMMLDAVEASLKEIREAGELA